MKIVFLILLGLNLIAPGILPAETINTTKRTRMSAQKTAESAAQKYWIDENNGPLGNMKDNGPDQPGPRIIAVTQVAASQEISALASLKISINNWNYANPADNQNQAP